MYIYIYKHLYIYLYIYMIGPPATTLVRYGAKYAGLIVYER
jgi:hypothetical protein